MQKDQMARQMGYESWEAYEKKASDVYDADKSVPKWRRGKGVK
jgi:hypothetical protein